MKKIESNRIYLRELEVEDVSPAYVDWINDPDVNRYLESKKANLEELKQYVKEKKENQNCLFFGIFVKENNRHIGNIKLEPFDLKKKTATMGMMIGNKEYWGKGLGTEVLKTLVDWTFCNTDIELIDLGVKANNKAAKKVYEKVGFKILKEKENGDLIMGIKKIKLALGTAQFGLDYGINNKKGKINEEEAFKILNYLLENNIDTIDTASFYGDSEKIIGKFIKKNNNFKIITKISSIDSFNKSLKILNNKKIYACLIHNFNSFKKNQKIWNNLKQLKKRNKVEKIGFSLYYPEEINYLLNKKIDFDIVQVPYNVFDQRFANLFPMLKSKGVEIHVRSVFLQGLMFKNPIHLKKTFAIIKDKLIQLQSIVKESNITIYSLCINFAALNKYVNKIIVGVDCLNNLKENINALKQKEKVIPLYQRLVELKEENENIILPFNWVKK